MPRASRARSEPATSAIRFCQPIHSRTRVSTTSSGNAPPRSSTSWNSRTLKRSPSLLLRFLAQRAKPQLADLVRERLTGPGDVAFELRLDVVRGERRVLGEAAPRLFDVPAEPVDAGVGDEPARAPHLVGVPTEALIRIAIDAHLLAEKLGIQAPAFDERRRPGVAAEVRHDLRAPAPSAICRWWPGTASCTVSAGSS